jgi:hypothetical protein
MLQLVEKFSGFTLDRRIGGKFPLLYGEYVEFSVYLPEFGWIGGKFPHNNS